MEAGRKTRRCGVVSDLSSRRNLQLADRATHSVSGPTRCDIFAAVLMGVPLTSIPLCEWNVYVVVRCAPMAWYCGWWELRTCADEGV